MKKEFSHLQLEKKLVFFGRISTFVFFFYYFLYLYRTDHEVFRELDPNHYFSALGIFISIAGIFSAKRYVLISTISYLIGISLYYYSGNIGIEHTSHTATYFVLVGLSPLFYPSHLHLKTRIYPLVIFLVGFYFFTALDKWNRHWWFYGDAFTKLSLIPGFSTDIGQFLISISWIENYGPPFILFLEFILSPFLLLGIRYPKFLRAGAIGIVLLHCMLLLAVDVGYLPIILILSGLLLYWTSTLKDSHDQREPKWNIFATFSIPVLIVIFHPILFEGQFTKNDALKLVTWSFMSNPSPYILEVEVWVQDHQNSQVRKVFRGTDQQNSIVSALFQRNEGPIARHLYLRFVLNETNGLGPDSVRNNPFFSGLRRYCLSPANESIQVKITTKEGDSTLTIPCSIN